MLSLKNFRFEQILGPKNVWSEINVGSEKTYGPVGKKLIEGNNFGSRKKSLAKKKLELKKLYWFHMSQLLLFC